MTAITTAEQAILTALYPQNREIPTTQVARLGDPITAARRTKLNRLGFIHSYKTGARWMHEITEKGADWLRTQPGHRAELDVLTAAYAIHAKQDHARAVRIADIRDYIRTNLTPDTSDEDIDDALTFLWHHRPGFAVESEADQKTLTDRDREHGLRLASDLIKHNVRIYA